MPDSRKIRELALQILFVWDAHGDKDDALAIQIATDHSEDGPTRSRAIELATGTWNNRANSDAHVERLAPQWPVKRQPAVDRNIIRLAIHELTTNHAPPKVVIDEAIELSKEYSTENSPAFVNGVLDAVLKEHVLLTGAESERRRDEETK